MLLVTGASGQLGSRIHARLVDRGLTPLAGTRAPARFGALGRRMDFDDPATLGLAGVEVLLLISAGYAEDDVVIARHDRVIAAAERAGVRHVIYTSLTGAGDHLAFALAHRWTEGRLRRSPVAWTILRNGLYAELFGSLLAPVDGVIPAPFGGGAMAAVARDDLADVAARVAAEVAADPSRHRGHTYELAGAAALTAGDVASALGVPYAPASLADTRAALARADLLPFQPPMLMSIYAATGAGCLGGTRTDLVALLPRAPRGTLEIAAASAAR